MSTWQQASTTALPAEQRELVDAILDALDDLSHDRDDDGQLMVAPGTDGQVRLILGPPAEGDQRTPTLVAQLAAQRLAAAGLRLTVDPDRLAEGYAVRVARRSGRPEVGRPIMVRFPEELLTRVDARAESTGTSRAAVIRELVETGLA